MTDAPATVLVVDDSPENRYTARRYLTRGGFDIWEAETGEEGLRRAAEDPDLILLDVHLPDIDGFEVCRRLKENPLTQHIPILQRSQSHVDDAARVYGLESGADAYLTEPVDPSVLVATARALLRVRRAENRLRHEVNRVETLNRVGGALLNALTRAEVLTAVARHLRGEVGTRDMSVYLFDDDRRRLELAYSTLPDAPPAERAGPVVAVAQTGEPAFGDADSLAGEFPELADGFRGRGGGGWGIVPLTNYGRRVGALAVSFDAGVQVERHLLAALAAQCAQALERAGLYEYQRHIATTLQIGLLPKTLPAVPGADVAARYNAGARAMDVGGDFYDVFPRGDEWLMVIGDVCGRGAEAAALTGLARHTIRAQAQHLQLPSEILFALHEAIVAEIGPDSARFVTAGCIRLRADWSVTAALAGHPPGLITRADGSVDALPPTGPLLGLLEITEINDAETRLGPGDALVLYTDGVIEARRGRELLGEERLRAVLAGLGPARATADAIADAIHNATIEYADSTEDDMAILVLRRTA